jgi:alpha-galactosidase
MIQTPPFIQLNSQNTSVILELPPNEAPLWRYWGGRLPDLCEPEAALRDTRPLPTYMLDFDQPLTIMPTFGVAWMGQSALLAHRAGQDFAQAFDSCTLQWIRPHQAVCLQLHDSVASLQVDITIDLNPQTNVLRISTRLHNLASTRLDIQWLAAATLPLPVNSQSVRYYAGQHNNEFIEKNDDLSRSIWKRESRRGRTSHDCSPSAVVLTEGATDFSGLVFGAHLAWSGNHQQSIEWLHDGQYQWQMGEWLAPGEGLLEAGQTWQSPTLLASCSDQGCNGLAHHFHTELRQQLPWLEKKMRPRPVHLNTWEGFYFDVHPEPVKELATAAAALGIERFVLDDGWFHGRHHDRAALGDWWPDESKFPNGLNDLIDHVNQLGMEFGIWFEPEMVNPNSDLFRQHSDWALQIAGRPLITARNQLVLDIARPEVSDYLYKKIAGLLSQHPIAYIKWDHNRDLNTAGFQQGTAAYRAQVFAAYALMQKLGQAFPKLEIESCSGGGGRIDFGVLQYAHRVWTSDCIDALSRVQIQRGFLQFFPPEIMGSHVGTAPAHTTGRTQNMSFRAAVALTGHLGVELDVRHLSACESQELKAWIGFYKQLRDRLHGGQIWRGSSADGWVWQAHANANANSSDKEQTNAASIILCVYRLTPTDHRYTPPIMLPMLDESAQYEVAQLSPAGISARTGMQSSAPFFEILKTASSTISGAWLKHKGLAMPRAAAETAFIYELTPTKLST